MVKISRNEEQLNNLEDFCDILVHKQQLSEIIEEDRETEYEKTMQKGLLSKGDSNVSRNVMSMKQSNSYSNLRNIGNGLQARDEKSASPSPVPAT
jgi:hypothetical protein